MKEETRQRGLSEKKRYVLTAINRMAIGVIIVLLGSLLMLKQVGVIAEGVSTLPFILVAFGALLVFGGIYRLLARNETTI